MTSARQCSEAEERPDDGEETHGDDADVPSRLDDTLPGGVGEFIVAEGRIALKHGVDGRTRILDEPSDAVLDRYAALSDAELANPSGQRVIETRWNIGIIAVGLLSIVWALIGFAALPS